jgi:replicative DNA helicase
VVRFLIRRGTAIRSDQDETAKLSRRAVLPASEWTDHLIEYLGQARSGGLAGVSTGPRDLDTMTLGLS